MDKYQATTGAKFTPKKARKCNYILDIERNDYAII